MSGIKTFFYVILILSILFLLITIGIGIGGILTLKKPINPVIYSSDFRQECFITSCEEPNLAFTQQPEFSRFQNPFSLFPSNIVGDVCNSTIHNPGSWQSGNMHMTQVGPDGALAAWEGKLKFAIKPNDILTYYADMRAEVDLGQHNFTTDLIHPDGPGFDPRLALGGYALFLYDTETNVCAEGGCIYTACWFLTKDAAYMAHDSGVVGSTDRKAWQYLKQLRSVTFDTSKVNRYSVEYNRQNKTLSWLINDEVVYQYSNIGFQPTPQAPADFINIRTGNEFSTDPSQASINWFIGGPVFSALRREGGPNVGLEDNSSYGPDQADPLVFDKPSVDVSFNRRVQIHVSNSKMMRYTLDE